MMAEMMAEQEKEYGMDKSCSVEFGITSKGLWSGKVKAYAETIDEAFEKAHVHAIRMNQIIKANNMGDASE